MTGPPPQAARAPAPAPFDAAAPTYDATFTDTTLGTMLRRRAWSWLDRAFGPGDRVLEIGCGTGADALHLAERGVRVVATDVSPAMLEATRRRTLIRDANDLVTVQPLDLARVGPPGWDAGLPAPFDGALSDFGAIDCVPDRVPLLRALASVVRSGGRVVLVGMSPVCPWEMAWHLAHGEAPAAARRFRAGARAGVGDGASIRVWYPSAARVAREAAPWFREVARGGIGVALPPSGLSVAMERRPWLLRLAAPAERRLAAGRLGAALADHWVLDLVRRDA
jgi:SAM-dependent methyltransferase